MQSVVRRAGEVDGRGAVLVIIVIWVPDADSVTWYAVPPAPTWKHRQVADDGDPVDRHRDGFCSPFRRGRHRR